MFHIDLTQNQADKLWDCLTTITGTTGINREELYNWLLSQLKNRDSGHALSLETFKHLLTEKVFNYVFLLFFFLPSKGIKRG